MLFLMLFLSLGTEFKHTAIFKPLNSDLIAVASSGEVFILDRDDQKILKYDAQGNQTMKIGRPGEGPGEFKMLMSIRVIGQSLFALDMIGVHEFDFEGNLIKDHVVKKMGTMLMPSTNGFLYTGNEFDMATKGMKMIYKWVDKDLKEVKPLGEVTMEMKFSGMGTKEMTTSFNPAERRAMGKVDQTGKFLIFKGQDDSPITLYSLVPEFKELLKLKLPNRKALPFNKEWADGMIENMNEDRPGQANRGFKMKFVADYPSHFPIIQSVGVTADNLIQVNFWSKSPEKPDRLFFDWNGNPVKSSWNPEHRFRIAHISGDMAYVTSYDKENEDYGCVMMPVKEVGEWVETHPFTEMSEYNQIMMIAQ